MNIHLTSKPIYNQKVTEFITYDFDGTTIRTYLNGYLADEQPAAPGECFYILPQGQKKNPKVTRAVMPEKRGHRIAWALDFIGEKKLANSPQEFMEKYQLFVNKELEHTAIMFISQYDAKDYGFVFEEVPGKSLAKPILAWVSDNITEEALSTLLSTFVAYRPYFCPEEFIFLQ